jgi:hypothetical protein
LNKEKKGFPLKQAKKKPEAELKLIDDYEKSLNDDSLRIGMIMDSLRLQSKLFVSRSK